MAKRVLLACAALIWVTPLYAQTITAISALPAASALAGTEPIPTVQASTTKKTTPSALLTYIQGAIALPASAITSGTLSSSLLAGSYTGITGVGTLSVGSIPQSLVTGLGTFATANAATPPAIGGTTPATITATTLTASTINDSGLTASVNVCADGSKNLTSACTNEVAITNLAQIGANTVLGNATAGTANVATQAMPSCSAATSALIWTTSTGFGCNTLSAIPANLTLTNPASAATLTVGGGLTLSLTGSSTPTLAFGAGAATLTFPTTATTIAGLSTAQSWGGANTVTNTWTYSTGALNFSSTGTLQANAGKLGSGTALSTCAEAGTGSPTCSYTTTAGSFSEKITLASSSAATSITLTFPNAVTNGYICDGFDATTTTERLKQTALTTTSATLTYYNDAGTATSPGATDVLYVKCMGN